MALMPPVACSGDGTDGWQMLFRSPRRPLEPALQKPVRPPMSPRIGSWQGPAGSAGVIRAVRTTGVLGVLDVEWTRGVEGAGVRTGSEVGGWAGVLPPAWVAAWAWVAA